LNRKIGSFLSLSKKVYHIGNKISNTFQFLLYFHPFNPKQTYFLFLDSIMKKMARTYKKTSFEKAKKGYIKTVFCIAFSILLWYNNINFLRSEKMRKNWIKAGQNVGEAVITFEKVFALIKGKRVKKATLQASAMGVYAASCNGERLGKGVLTPDWTSYRSRIFYQTYDITHLLQEKNLLQIGVGQGWAMLDKNLGRVYTDHVSLNAQVTIEYENGKKQTFYTDESWEVKTSEVLFAGIYHGETVDKTAGYVLAACEAAAWMGATRVVIHTGALMKRSRKEAQAVAMQVLPQVLERCDAAGYGHIILCPETMGKINQLGDLDEVLELCTLDERLLPCVDFGHLYARSLGADEGLEATVRMLDRMKEVLGEERASRFHSHFSRIEFTPNGGEKCHRTFADNGGFGPDPMPLMAELARRGWSPTIICESAGTQAEDALFMKRQYQSFLKEV
jgi:deoxyribonuclease-4